MRLDKEIIRQIWHITNVFIKNGISIAQNFPSEKNGKICWVGFKNVSFILKNEAYDNIYKEILVNKDFNILMIDGGIIQLLYRFNKRKDLEEHILAFYPHPSFIKYQDVPEKYEDFLYGIELFGDVQKGRIVTFPIRFDYSQVHNEIVHPKAHLTLGNYSSCRIPVSKPISPYRFIKFILMNFYSNKKDKFWKVMNEFKDNINFPETITEREKEILHIHYI